jgi:hypothetical protein
MGRVARYKRIKTCDPGSKKRPAPVDKVMRDMAPKHDPDVIPTKLAEMMRKQSASNTLRASAVPITSHAPSQGASESPQDYYKVRSINVFCAHGRVCRVLCVILVSFVHAANQAVSRREHEGV